MRRALSSLASYRGKVASYSTQAPKPDYGLVLTKSEELSAKADVPKTEIGYADGVPLETFNRKVGQRALRCCWVAAS